MLAKALLALGAVSAMSFSGCANPSHEESTGSKDTAQFRELSIVDREGRIRIVLSAAEPSGASISMLNEAGKTIVKVVVNQDSKPNFTMTDSNGVERLRAEFDGNQSRIVAISPDVAGRLELSATSPGQALVRTVSRTEGAASLGSIEKQGVGVVLTQPNGEPRAELSFKDNSDAGLAFFGAEGVRRMWLTQTYMAAGGMCIADKKSSVRLYCGFDPRKQHAWLFLKDSQEQNQIDFNVRDEKGASIEVGNVSRNAVGRLEIDNDGHCLFALKRDLKDRLLLKLPISGKATMSLIDDSGAPIWSEPK